MPEEILDEIFGHLQSDRSALASCTLVCAQWHLASSRLFLQFAFIRPNRDTFRFAHTTKFRRLTALTKTSTRVSSMILNLNMCGFSNLDFLALEKIVMHLKNLRLLNLIGITFAPLAKPQTYIPALYDGTLETLSVSAGSETSMQVAGAPGVLDALLWFKEVKTLKVERVHPYNALHVLRGFPEHRVHVHAVHVIGSAASEVAAASAYFDSRSLSGLTLSYLSALDVQAANKLLTSFGGNLKKCTISANAAGNMTRQPGQYTAAHGEFITALIAFHLSGYELTHELLRFSECANIQTLSLHCCLSLGSDPLAIVRLWKFYTESIAKANSLQSLAVSLTCEALSGGVNDRHIFATFLATLDWPHFDYLIQRIDNISNIDFSLKTVFSDICPCCCNGDIPPTAECKDVIIQAISPRIRNITSIR